MTTGEIDEYGTVAVLARHKFDEEKLKRYLAAILPAGTQDFALRQFQGGQSNPTYLIHAAGRRYVLRKKPPGKLLRGAHQVEREYRVMKALETESVPVPQMLHLCEDETVIGSAFFIMEYLSGRLEQDPSLPEFDPLTRKPLFFSLARNLARLHQIDWRAAGLADFGRAENYIGRQVKTWTRQYEAAKTDEMPAMDGLIEWLNSRDTPEQAATIVHGDYRVGNVIFDSQLPKVAAVLDWELSTIGHPLADLGYFCMPWYLPADITGARGLKGRDLVADGLPEVEEIVAVYCAERGIAQIQDLEYFVAFSLFRLAAIVQGVYARGLAGNASNADALEVGARAAMLAETGWAIVRDAVD